MNKEIMRNIEVLDSLPIVNQALKILHFRRGRINEKYSNIMIMKLLIGQYIQNIY